MTARELTAAERFTVWLIHGVLQAFAMTWKFRVSGDQHLRVAASCLPSGSYAQICWHENILASIVLLRGTKTAPLASLSKDGAIVTAVMEKMRFRTIRGSSSRGGAEAREELVKVTADGYLPTITPDGPRGPRRVLKSGVVDIARRAGIPIVPFAAVADRHWVLHKSWDQFRIPKPFATIHVVYGEPVSVPPDAHGSAFGEARARVQSALDSTQAAAEANASRPG
ncbi:DUF374 domain-containing protein [bacterium]|nr:DUF374 domain-containing protein [bacterium]